MIHLHISSYQDMVTIWAVIIKPDKQYTYKLHTHNIVGC